MTRAEWRRGSDFAEYAEALDVSTLDIMVVGTQKQDGRLFVIYTTDTHDLSIAKAWSRTLERGADGILHPIGERAEMPTLTRALGTMARRR